MWEPNPSIISTPELEKHKNVQQFNANFVTDKSGRIIGTLQNDNDSVQITDEMLLERLLSNLH